jgi:hypothetical protein
MMFSVGFCYTELVGHLIKLKENAHKKLVVKYKGYKSHVCARPKYVFNCLYCTVRTLSR